MGSAYPTIAADAIARYQVRLPRPAWPCLLSAGFACSGHRWWEARHRPHPLPCAHSPSLQRLQGKEVTFITGTDEHGEKIALAAQKRGLAPKEHCDDIVASYKDLWRDVRELLLPPPSCASRQRQPACSLHI